MYLYQQLPRGANWPLWDGELTPWYTNISWADIWLFPTSVTTSPFCFCDSCGSTLFNRTWRPHVQRCLFFSWRNDTILHLQICFRKKISTVASKGLEKKNTPKTPVSTSILWRKKKDVLIIRAVLCLRKWKGTKKWAGLLRGGGSLSLN